MELELKVFGPGALRRSYSFQDALSLVEYQVQFERQLLSNGYGVLPHSERRNRIMTVAGNRAPRKTGASSDDRRTRDAPHRRQERFARAADLGGATSHRDGDRAHQRRRTDARDGTGAELLWRRRTAADCPRSRGHPRSAPQLRMVPVTRPSEPGALGGTGAPAPSPLRSSRRTLFGLHFAAMRKAACHLSSS